MNLANMRRTVGFPTIPDKSNYTLSQTMYYTVPYSTYCARSISVVAIIKHNYCLFGAIWDLIAHLKVKYAHNAKNEISLYAFYFRE